MMSRLLRLSASVSLALMMTACAAATAPDLTALAQAEVQAPAAARPNVILVSIDGFRADYLNRGHTPVLAGLAAAGASGPMRPSFPSVTFPNHYTLVTGLHPDHHGIVGNNMVDAELGRFSLGNKQAVTDRRWWDQGEPIWVTAERAGIRTGTMFWPGSEAEIRGVRPSYWTEFDQSMADDARVERVLGWMDLPPADRPQLTTLYFDIVDTQGHRFGPDAPQTAEALRTVDASIGRLVEGLKKRGLYDNTVLIIVSDHGMAATSPDHVTVLDDLIDPAAVQIVYSGAVSFLNVVPGREAEVEAGLLGSRPHLDCWKKDEIPARLVLGSNPRVSDIVCASEPGWLLATRARPVTRPGGAHGYDNQSPQMAAIFIAHGPGVVQGRQVAELDSVDVQPLLGRLLGIEVPKGDGRSEDTLPVTVR
ncbi:ectonucleotide pyrophosphatase/phosphodiesterase [Brevundimonas vesicularis]|uniref:alkaline phosphatase family protein n=1 Tax=Brevundimonas vesicularis TaxID=41276 RepID=UPI0038D383B0